MPRPGERFHRITSRSGSGYGSGRSRSALATLKTAAFAPMPSASDSTTDSVKPGAPREAAERVAQRRARSLEPLHPEAPRAREREDRLLGEGARVGELGERLVLAVDVGAQVREHQPRDRAGRRAPRAPSRRRPARARSASRRARRARGAPAGRSRTRPAGGRRGPRARRGSRAGPARTGTCSRRRVLPPARARLPSRVPRITAPLAANQRARAPEAPEPAVPGWLARSAPATSSGVAAASQRGSTATRSALLTRSSALIASPTARSRRNRRSSPGLGLGSEPGEHDGARRGRRPAARREPQVLAHQAQHVQQRPLVRRERCRASRPRATRDRARRPRPRAAARRAARGSRAARRGRRCGRAGRRRASRARRNGAGRSPTRRRASAPGARPASGSRPPRSGGRTPASRSSRAPRRAARRSRRGSRRPGLPRAPRRARSQLASTASWPRRSRRGSLSRNSDSRRRRPASPGHWASTASRCRRLISYRISSRRGCSRSRNATVQYGQLGSLRGAGEARDERGAGAGPGLVPAEALLVEQDPHPLGDRERAALVGQQQRAAVRLRRAHGARATCSSSARSRAGSSHFSCERRRGQHVLAHEAAGGGERRHELLDGLDPGARRRGRGHGGGLLIPLILSEAKPRRPEACDIVGRMSQDPALDLLFKSHPWHGVAIGPDAPRRVTVFVEIVPSDTVKYELDKDSGLLKVDRPQLYSNVCPSPYGFVPRTLCGPEVARLAEERTGRRGLVGDDDPLDILVLTEKDFAHGNLLVQALPIGGLGMLDGNEVDDKIVAVMAKDAVYGGVERRRPAAEPADRPPQALLPDLQAGARGQAPGLRAAAGLRARRGLRGDPPQPGRLRRALRARARRARRAGLSVDSDRRHRRRRLHRRELRAPRARAHRRARGGARQAHLRGQPREPGRRRGEPALRVRAGRHRGPRGRARAAARRAAPRPSSTSRPRPTSTARSTTRPRSCAPT